MGTTKTDFLFATPTLIGGAATVFSLGGFRPSYNQSETPSEADARAIRSDWAITGDDMVAAANRLTTDALSNDEQ